jgi:hypothetical protein
MKTLDTILRFFLLLVCIFFVAILYTNNLLPEFINTVIFILNKIIFQVAQLF